MKDNGKLDLLVDWLVTVLFWSFIVSEVGNNTATSDHPGFSG